MSWQKTVRESAAGERECEIAALNGSRGFYILNGPINTQTATDLIAAAKYHADRGEPMTICINSPGGEVLAGLAMYDVIQAYPHELTLICTGLAASMAAILLAGGKKGCRFILPHSKVMIHEPLMTDGFGGSATTIEKKAQSILDTKATLNGILAKHTGKTIEEINEATAFDNVMSAEEAIVFGICDAVTDIFKGGNHNV